MAVEQLTLNVQLRDSAHFDNFFVTPKNATAVDFLQAFLKSNQANYAYLWGKSGAGRSHLLQACCYRAEQLNLVTAYLPMSDQLSPEMLENLEYSDIVCIDDIDLIAGKREWEEGLFHFFNRIKMTGKHLLISGKCAPRELAMNLADLQSRLTSGVIFQLSELSDAEKLTALQLRSKNRGLQLPDEVGEFLIRRWTRDMHGLFGALDKLDHASLAEQRKLTVPFVKQVLSL